MKRKSYVTNKHINKVSHLFFNTALKTKLMLVAMVAMVFSSASILTLMNANKTNLEEKERLDLLADTLTQDYYEEMLGNQIPVSALKFVKNESNTGAKLVGFNDNLVEEDAKTKYLVIPDKVTIDYNIYDVEEIDFEWIDEKNPTNSGQANKNIQYIKGIKVPNTVKYIEEASFWGFGALEYLEIPFLGIRQGSSALDHLGKHVDDENNTITSYPLVKMFDNHLYGGYDGYSYNSENSQLTKIETQSVPWYEINTGESKAYNLPGNLQKVVINNDTAFGNHAIFGINSLRYIDIKNESNSIVVYNYAFAENQSLIHVDLPSSNITLNGVGIFSKNSKLGSDKKPIIIPEHESVLGNSLFSFCTSLEEVYIPSTIEKIDDGAFAECNDLIRITKYINTTDNLSDNEYTAWYSNQDGSKVLGGINLPKGSLKYIGEDAFKNCSKIKSLTIPKCVKYIGKNALSGCTSLETLSVPFIGTHRSEDPCDTKLCNTTDQNASNYHNLFGVIFGNNISDGMYVSEVKYREDNEKLSIKFGIPKRLTSLYITDETEISYHSLQNLTSLTYLNIGYKKNESENPSLKVALGALNGASNLKELVIPFAGEKNTGGHIGWIFGNSAYSGGSISSSGYYLPESLETITLTHANTVYSDTFANCTKIKKVIISDKTTYIESNIFYNNDALAELELPFVGNTRGWWYSTYWCATCQTYHSSGWYWRDTAMRNTLMWLFSSNSNQGGVYANHTLSAWDSWIRYIPNTLKAVTITDDTAISTYAFRYFSSLESITITDSNNNLLSVADSSMIGCSSLKNLTVPFLGQDRNTTTVSGKEYCLGWYFGSSSYANSYKVDEYGTHYLPESLTTVTVLDKSSIVSDQAYKDAKSLTDITIGGASEIIKIGAYAFANCENLNNLEIINAAYNTLGDYAFYNCKRITNIKNEKIFPNALKSIGAYAFASSGIISISNNSIDLTKYESIGAYAFANCAGIEYIVIPQNLKIDEGIFQDCTNLSYVKHNGNVSKNLFKNCISLTSVDFTYVTEIPEGVLSGCVNLTDFIQNDTVTSIGDYAFYHCSSLKNFEIRNTTTSIGAFAFAECSSLASMIIPKETTHIAANAWLDTDINFYFRVYKKRADWPETWAPNWYCDRRVFVIGENDEDTFTFRFSGADRGYYVTGVKPGITLEGQVRLPSEYCALKVVGVENTGSIDNDDNLIPNTKFSDQVSVTSYIIPESYYYIKDGSFQNNNRVDLYFESSYEKATSYYGKTIDNKNLGWTEEDHYKFISAGFVLYKGNHWDYSSVNGISMPHILLANSSVEIDKKTLIYNGEQHKPNVLKITLPGYLVDNNSLNLNDLAVFDLSGDQIDDSGVYNHYIDMFKFTYKNNVNATTPRSKAYVNISLIPAKYNGYLDYFNSLDSSNGLYDKFNHNTFYLLGEISCEFEIDKAFVDIYSDQLADDYKSIEEVTYNGKTHRFGSSDWKNHIYGLEDFPGAKFSGILETYSESVLPDGYYEMKLDTDISDPAGKLIWASDPRITRNGADITDNFKIKVYLKVKINPMKVAIEWTGGEMVDGYYSYKYAGHKGIDLSEAAYAYQWDSDNQANKTKVNNCDVVVVKPTKKDVSNSIPSALENDTVYEAYAYLKDNKNYQLVDSKTGKSIVEKSHGYNTNTLIADDLLFKIVKGKVVVSFEIDYKIPSSIARWEIDFAKDKKYVSGLGEDTIFDAMLYTNSDAPITYNYKNNNSDLQFSEYTGSNIDFDGLLSWKTRGVNYTTTKLDDTNSQMFKSYHLYYYDEKQGLNIDESDYYDLIINKATVNIKYNSFDNSVYYTVGIPKLDSNGNVIVDYNDDNGIDTTKKVSFTKNDNTHVINYNVDGRFYHFKMLTDGYEKIEHFKTQYFYTRSENGQVINQKIDANYLEIQSVNCHTFGVTLSGKHYITEQINLVINALRSDIEFNSFTREYNRKPHDILSENMIKKMGFDVKNTPSDETQNISFEYYDVVLNANNEIISRTLRESAPIEVGKYLVVINANETDFFNGLTDKEYLFEIEKRRILIDLSVNGKRKYDGNYQIFTPLETDLNRFLLPEETVNGIHYFADTFVGTLQTNSKAPGIYSWENGNIYWSIPWAVYDGNNNNKSSNYQVVILKEYEILPLEFKVVINGATQGTIIEHDYTGDYYPNNTAPALSITRDPSDPGENYHIYYSRNPIPTDPLNIRGCLKDMPYTFDEPGEYTQYFVVVGDNYKIYDGEFTIKINELEIDYDNQDNKDGKLDNAVVVEYTGSNYSYEVIVNAPLFCDVYYSYKKEDGSWTEYTFDRPIFIEAGRYNIKYKLEAIYYTTVEEEIEFVITEDGKNTLDVTGKTPSTEDDFIINSFDGYYDGKSHGISIQTQFSLYNIWYSLDGEEWTKNPIEYVEPGEYKVYVKVKVPTYAVFTGRYTITINPRKFEQENQSFIYITDYNGVFDNLYHSVGLAGDRLLIKKESVLDKDNPESYITKDVYYYIDDELGEIKLDIKYTSDQNVIAAGYGYSDYVEYKDCGSYRIFVVLSAENFEDKILLSQDGTRNYGTVDIARLVNPTTTYEYTEIEYSGNVLDTTKLNINTQADGQRIYKFWVASYDSSANEIKCDFTEPIAYPKNVGYYAFTCTIKQSQNASGVTITNDVDGNSCFFRITPKTLEVKWDENVEYDKLEKDPNPYVETNIPGESVELNYWFIDSSIQSAIEVGQYKYHIEMLYQNDNFILDRDEITMNVTKRRIEFIFNDSKEYDDEIYTRSSGWDELMNLPLLTGHYFKATVTTSKAVKGTYIYDSNLDNNGLKVAVVNYQFVSYQFEKDALGNYLYDDAGKLIPILDTEFSVDEFYDVYAKITIKITDPVIKLENIEDTIVSYDGEVHSIKVANQLSVLYNGAIIQYKNYDENISLEEYKEDEDGWASTPGAVKEAGTYSYVIKVIKPGFETSVKVVKLIIEKANLEIVVNPLEDPLDPSTAGYSIYDGTDKKLTYDVVNILPNSINKSSLIHIFYDDPQTPVDESYTEQGCMRFYRVNDYSLSQLREFYENFDEDNEIFAKGLKSIKNAGKYYVVIYYKNQNKMWNECIHIETVEIVQRDIVVQFKENSIINKSKIYDGTPLTVCIATANIEQMKSYLVPGHKFEGNIITYFAETNKSDAGYYNPATDMQFSKSVVIKGPDSDENLYYNYRPILCGGQISLEITKAYLTDADFKIMDTTTIYNGQNIMPDIICKSDGTLEVNYYEEAGGAYIPLPDEQKNAGSYVVKVAVGEGKNYYSSMDSGIGEDGFLTAKVTVKPKEVEVEWSNLEQTFTGDKLTANAQIEDVYHEKQPLDIIYYLNYSETSNDGIISSGAYEVYAVINTTEDNGKELANNYILKDQVKTFVINKLVLEIVIGSSENGYIEYYYGSDSPWSKTISSNNFNSFPEALQLCGENGIGDTNPRIATNANESGLYTSVYMFNLLFTIYDSGNNKAFDPNPNADSTNSIDISVIGSVNILSNNVPYSTNDMALVYSKNSNHTFASLVSKGMIKVNANIEYNLSYKVTYPDGTSDSEFTSDLTKQDVFKDVGTYIITFRISEKAGKHDDTTGEVQVEIVPANYSIVYDESKLNKVYDGIAIDGTAFVKAFDGNTDVTNLKYTYYEYKSFGSSNIQKVELAENPIDAGRYSVVITSVDDKKNKYGLYNYNFINEEKEIFISALSLDFKLTDYILKNSDGKVVIDKGDIVITNKDLNKNWSSGYLTLNAAEYDSLHSGDNFTIKIETKYVQRTDYSYNGKVEYNGNSYIDTTEKIELNNEKVDCSYERQVFTFKALGTDNKPYDINMAWNITNDSRYKIVNNNGKETRVYTDLSRNYSINLDFDIFIHYKKISDVHVTGGNYNYDGNQHSGTYEVGANCNAVLDGLTVTATFASTLDGLDDPNKRSNNITDVYFTKPGEHKIFYRIEANSEGYEITKGYVIINIRKVDMDVKYENSYSYIYSGSPQFEKWLNGCDYYIPKFELIGKEGLPLDYDSRNLKAVYTKVGSTGSIDPSSGIIDAGKYKLVVTIPESTYYNEKKLTFDITINKKNLYLANKSNINNILPYQGAKLYYTVTDDNQFYQIEDDQGNIINNVKIKGALQTNSIHFINVNGNLEQYTGSQTAGDSGIYSGINQNSLGWYKSCTVIINDEDQSSNYEVNLKKATITIAPADITMYGNYNQVFDYDGTSHIISVSTINPLKPDEIYFFDVNQNDWELVYQGSWNNTKLEKFKKSQPGTYTYNVKVCKKNYNDKELTYTMIINPTALDAKFLNPSELDKKYDGNDVALPKSIYTNNDALNYENYVFEFYELETDTEHVEWLAFGKISWGDINGSYGWKRESFVYDGINQGLAIPVNVGKYKVKVKIPEVGHYSGKEIEMEFEIKPYVINIDWSNDDIIYNGQVQAPKANVNFQYFKKDNMVLDIVYTNTQTNNVEDPINSGSYIATASISKELEKSTNYTISSETNTKTFTISKRSIIVKCNQKLTVPASGLDNSEFIFSHNAVDATKRFVVENIVNNQKVTPAIEHYVSARLKVKTPAVGTFSNLDSFMWIDENDDETNIQILSNNGEDVTSNYNISYGLSVKIDYNTIEVTSTGYNGVYDGKYHGISLTISNLNQQEFKIYYSNDGNTYYSESSSINWVKDVTVTDSNPNGKEIYYKVVKINPSTGQEVSGYSPVIGSEFVAITQKAAGLNFTDTFGFAKEYDGIPREIKEDDLIFDSEITRPVLEYSYYKKGDQTPLGYIPTNVGEYRVVVKLSDGTSSTGISNFSNASISYDFEIEKRTVYITSKTALSMIYNGANGGTVWQADVNTSPYISIKNLAPDQGFHDNETIITTLSPNIGHYTDTTMVYDSDGHIIEEQSGQFRWVNGYKIYDKNGEEVTNNYSVKLGLDVTINKSPIAVENANNLSYNILYDSLEHGLTINLIDYVDTVSGIIYPKPSKFEIYYSTDGWVTQTQIAPTVKDADTSKYINFKIVAENYIDFYGGGTVTVEGLKFGDLVPDPSNPDAMYISYDKTFIYSGYKYPTPVLMNCPSNGEQHVYYYAYDAVENGQLISNATPLLEAPKDQGLYWFRLAIDSDGIYETVDNVALLSFEIKPIDVEVVFDDLSLVYTGGNLMPKAYYMLVGPDWNKGLGDINGDGVVELTALAPLADGETYPSSYDTIVNQIRNAINVLAGTYKVTAFTNNSNYNLLVKNQAGEVSNPTVDFEITKKEILEFKLMDDLRFTYFKDEIRIIDSNGYLYEIDSDGTILKIYKGLDKENDEVLYDNMIATDTEKEKYLYKILLQKNPDGSLNLNAGTYKITVVLDDKDNYMWETGKNSNDLEYTYTIDRLRVDEYNLDYSISVTFKTSNTPTYTGAPIEPQMIVKLLNRVTSETLLTLVYGNDKDYDLTYENNIEVSETNENPDKAKVIVTGLNNFDFSYQEEFTILAEAPKLLQIKEDSKLQFITAKYDTSEFRAYIREEICDDIMDTLLSMNGTLSTEEFNKLKNKYNLSSIIVDNSLSGSNEDVFLNSVIIKYNLSELVESYESGTLLEKAIKAISNKYSPERTTDSINYLKTEGYTYYLGHLYEQRSVYSLINQLKDNDRILVFSSYDDMTSIDYKSKALSTNPDNTNNIYSQYISTGYWIALYKDENFDEQIDSIQCILFGDVDGNGNINANDFVATKNYILGTYCFKSLADIKMPNDLQNVIIFDDAYYYAGLVNREVIPNINATTAVYIKNYILGEVDYLFNEKYKYDEPVIEL